MSDVETVQGKIPVSEVWHRVDWYMGTDVLDELAASISGYTNTPVWVTPKK